jgi:rod shape determining protein RodA
MKIIFLLPLLFIYLFGLVNLFGISPNLATSSIIHFIIGLSLFTLIRYFQTKRHLNFFRDNSLLLYLLSIILLGITLFIGTEVNGSKRWIDLGFFPLQTSEIFKIFFISFLSAVLARRILKNMGKTIFIQSLIYTLIPIIIIFLQPDLKTSILIFAIFSFLVINSDIPKKYIFYLFGIFVILAPVTWGLMHDYQKNRVLSFISPQSDISGVSYNLIQAKITVGSGGFFGEGLRMGKQTQLSFLPENHTDFAFSSLVEQFGFIGGSLLILLYITFFFILFMRLRKLQDKQDYESRYNFFYTLGFSLIFIFQAAVNIGMNLGINPIAGVTLPFVSYGGSSLITFMIGLALLP